MRTANIRNSNQNILDFVRENFGGLAICQIWLDKTIFQEIWDECLEKNGKINVVNAEKLAKNKPSRVYSFSYFEIDNNGKKHSVDIALADYVAVNAQKFLVNKISAKNLEFNLNKSLIAPKITIGRQKVQSNIKEL